MKILKLSSCSNKRPHRTNFTVIFLALRSKKPPAKFSGEPGVMHSGGNSVHWYGARTVYHFGVSSEGVNVFEERVVCILAKDTEDAHSKAVKESEKYAESNDFEMYPEQVCYRQDGGKLINEYEVWSELFQSTQSLDEFYKERYLKYLYDPEKA